MRWASRAAVILLLLVVGAAVIALIGHLSETETTPQLAPVAEAPRLPPPAAGAQWRYTTPRTGWSSAAGVEACTKSLVDVDIGGGGRSSVLLCLRRGGGYPYAGSIVLNDMHGQFNCVDCEVRARFDNRASQSFSGTAASTDGSSYALFFRDGPALASALQRAATVTFAVSIRGAGAQEVTFDVAGLKWAR
jgi:hypothetical protein